MDTDSEIPELIETLAALISKTSSAITDFSAIKAIPGAAAPSTISELYDIIMANGITTLRKIEVK